MNSREEAISQDHTEEKKHQDVPGRGTGNSDGNPQGSYVRSRGEDPQALRISCCKGQGGQRTPVKPRTILRSRRMRLSLS